MKEKERRKGMAAFTAVHALLSLLILCGLAVMVFTDRFTAIILWLEMGLGFVWSSMMALLYLPEKRRGWFFAALGAVLALILLDGILNYIEY